MIATCISERVVIFHAIENVRRGRVRVDQTWSAHFCIACSTLPLPLCRVWIVWTFENCPGNQYVLVLFCAFSIFI